MGVYSQAFAHAMRTVTLWRGGRVATDHGTFADPTYAARSGFSARVHEIEGSEALLPVGPVAVKTAEITWDADVSVSPVPGDRIRDAAHPSGLHVWEVVTEPLYKAIPPRVTVKATRLLKVPAEMGGS